MGYFSSLIIARYRFYKINIYTIIVESMRFIGDWLSINGRRVNGGRVAWKEMVIYEIANV